MCFNVTMSGLKKRQRRSRGFSLIEVMVVVVIIGLLAGAVVLKVVDYMTTAKINRAKSDIATICNAIETFYLTNSRYPTNQEGLSKLSIERSKDPWGQPYQYNAPGQEGPYEVFTLGEDQREGGEGVNADIFSWDLESEQAAAEGT